MLCLKFLQYSLGVASGISQLYSSPEVFGLLVKAMHYVQLHSDLLLIYFLKRYALPVACQSSEVVNMFCKGFNVQVLCCLEVLKLLFSSM